jgi:membrane-associated phospholipid phosphatase
MKAREPRGGAALMGLILLIVPGLLGRADLVTDWNALFLDAIRRETTPPPLAARNLAILHVAIYDAVNSITFRHEPFCYGTEKPVPGSIEAAVAAAAYRVSVALYPSAKASFDVRFNASLGQVADAPRKTAGIALGYAAADAVLSWRSADGSSTSVPYIPGTDPGDWRRTPPFFRPPETPQWRYVVPFAMTRPAQFRPAGPPSLTSPQYAAELEQVRSLGARNSATRTPEQTEIAHFWSDFSYTVTPPGHWNEIARAVAANRSPTLEENARTFAWLNIALADAAIAAWDAKYEFNLWRPVTAIQQADLGGNPDRVRDPGWEPLLPTPPFPEYVSGHSAFSAAAAAVLAHAFGTDPISFTVGSDSLPGVVRTYRSFAETAEEIGLSRIHGGIHFLSADLDGLALGRALGEYVVRHTLQPLPALALTPNARQPGRWSLSWPAVFANYAVESADSLTAVNWTKVIEAPTVTDAVQTLTITPISPQRFFRLQGP